MFLSYLNFQLNAYPNKAPTKPPAIIDLREVYKHIARSAFPLRYKNIQLESIELCSNNKGCNPKVIGGTLDYLVAMKDSSGEMKTAQFNDPTKAILLNVRGKYKLGKTQCELYLRIPKSAAVGARLGMSTQHVIQIDDNADGQISKLQDEISQQIFDILSIVPILRPSKLVGMAVHGLNLHNPLTGERPEFKIKNFLQILRELNKHLKTHALDYDKKNGKQVARGNFKPKEPGSAPTFGVTSWTMVDFVGGQSVRQVIQLKNELVRAFEMSRIYIQYDLQSKKPITHGKRNELKKGCPKNIPVANADGMCPSDLYIPLPNKYGSLCCYKKKLTKSIATDVLQKYKAANMKIPEFLAEKLKKYAENTTSSSVKCAKKYTTPSGVYYNKRAKQFKYKDKQFKCMSLSKPMLESIALLMKVNPKGFKKDICNQITKKAKNTAVKKHSEAHFKFLKMKAKYMNKRAN